MSERPDRPDILGYNRDAWDRQVERGNRWTVRQRSSLVN